MVLVAVISSEVRAASLIYDQTTGNWNESEKWSGPTPRRVPVAGDSAFIRANRTVTVDSNVGTVDLVYLGASTAGGTVRINTGAQLRVTENFEVMRAGNFADISGTLTMSGGTLEVLGLLSVGMGNANNTNNVGISSGTATFSGGTFTGAITVGSQSSIVGIGYFNVTGSTVAISGSAFTVNAQGRVNFTLGASGVSELNYSTGTASFAAGSLFSVDGSAYTGPAGDIRLVDAGSLAWNVSAGDVSITGFNDYNALLLTQNNDIILRLTAVPEPVMAELSGAMALLLICRRYRRNA